MEEFLKHFTSVKKMQTLVPSRDQGFPPELHQEAKELVRMHMHKYSVLRIYEIILLNLKAGRKIDNIKQGLFSISKYPLCLFLDQERPEFHQIRTFSGYYTYEIKEQMESFEPILEAMGYRYDKQTQLYKLDKDIRLNPGFDDRIALIGCELLLAYEELNLFQEFSKNFNNEPIAHFSVLANQPQNMPTAAPYRPQPDPYIQYEQNANANPNTNPAYIGNMAKRQEFSPYPEISGSNPPYQEGQVHPHIGQPNMNSSTNMFNRPLPLPPNQQSGETEQPEVDVFPHQPAYHKTPQMTQTGEPYRPGMGEQKNASPQNQNIDQRSVNTAPGMDNQKAFTSQGQRNLGGVGIGNSPYEIIYSSNQGINQAEERGQSKPPNQQDMMTAETGRYAIRENYQGTYEGMNPQAGGRDGLGMPGQGHQGGHQDMNPQAGSRDGLRMPGQGHQRTHQGINPQDGGIDGMGMPGQGHQGGHQDMNPQAGGRDGLGMPDQGYQRTHQCINPQDGGRDGMGMPGQGHQGGHQDMNPQAGGRDGLGMPDQGYQRTHQGINPQAGGRDGMGMPGQGHQGGHQGVIPQAGGRDGLGMPGPWHQGAHQGMNPQDGGSDGLGMHDQGYQGTHQCMNPQDGGSDGLGMHDQGYQGTHQCMNPQDGGRDGMGMPGPWHQGAHQGMNPQAGGRDGLGMLGQGHQGTHQGVNPQNAGRDGIGMPGQGHQGTHQVMNPQDGGRDGMGMRGQGHQGTHQGVNPQNAGRDGLGMPQGHQRMPQGRLEDNRFGNPDGESGIIAKPSIGPKPTGMSSGANIHPTPINTSSPNFQKQPEGSFPNDDLPQHLDCYNNIPLSIHSETPRHNSMEKHGEIAQIEDVQLPNTGMKDQHTNANIDPHSKNDLFQSHAWESNKTADLHGPPATPSATNIERRISQEQQRSSGEQNRYSGQQQRYSGQQQRYSGPQQRYSGPQEHYSGQQRQMMTRDSDINLEINRVNSPPIQPLPKQVSENTYPRPMEQWDPTAHYRENPEQYRHEYQQNHPNYTQPGVYNNDNQPYQAQNILPNIPTNINRGIEQMNIKGDIHPTQYQYQDNPQGPMGDFRQEQGRDPNYNYHPQNLYEHREPTHDPVTHQYNKATGEMYQAPHPLSYPPHHQAIYDAHYKHKPTGQVYPHEPSVERHQAPYLYEDENMPYPPTKSDFSRPVGPNPNPKDIPDPRYQDAQGPGQEGYNPETYRDPPYRPDQDFYRQDQNAYIPNPDPPRQIPLPYSQATETRHQYRDPPMPYQPGMGNPERHDHGGDFRRVHEMDPQVDLPEDRLPFQDRIARFQHQPAPPPSQQQQQQAVSDKPWNCPHCTYQNSAFKKVCDMCSKTPDFLLGPNQAVPTHKRMCSFCKELNSMDARACSSCGRNFMPIN